jgi:hypothetical protein
MEYRANDMANLLASGLGVSRLTNHRPLDQRDRQTLTAYRGKNRTATAVIGIIALADLAVALGLIFADGPLWIKIAHLSIASLCLLFAYFFFSRWRRTVRDLREGRKAVECGTINNKYQIENKGVVTWTLVIDGKHQEAGADVWAAAEVGGEATLERAVHSRVILKLESSSSSSSS